MTNLDNLVLSRNNLTGAIPREIGSLMNLSGLHLVDVTT